MLNLTPPAAVPTNQARKPSAWTKPSPLMLCDRLISLAQDADRAGLSITAERLVHLAQGVFDEPTRAAA